jgi:HIV Tat-specific factor 1
MADFPTNVQDFDGDDRISFSRLDNKFIAVHDDGTEFEFDNDRKVWKPLEEQEFDDEAHDALHQHDPASISSNNNGKRRHPADENENGAEVSYHTLDTRRYRVAIT